MSVCAAKVESLSGKWEEETPWTPGEEEGAKGVASPCTGAAIAQDLLEPILRTAAVERGADLRKGVEMLSFSQAASGVIAHVRERDGGEEYDIHADYTSRRTGRTAPSASSSASRAPVSATSAP